MSGEPPHKKPRQDGGVDEKERKGGGVGGGGGALSGAWGFLKAPSAKDIRGKRRTAKAFDKPLKPYDYLVVMDFEWTCDNKRRVDPLEIIEFPAVLVRSSFPPQIVDEFQVYCRPSVNPRLSAFCTQLTAITQDMVDAGVPLSEAIRMHSQWLQRHGLVARGGVEGGGGGGDRVNGGRGGQGSDDEDVESSFGEGPSFCTVTWGDSDVMTALHSELTRLGIKRPPHFDKWINLKALFKSHYKREAKGGLQACVEGCGLTFEGRAHSGLVDSINTAKIVVQMIQQGYKFTRSTRGFAPDGEAWGARRRPPQGSPPQDKGSVGVRWGAAGASGRVHSDTGGQQSGGAGGQQHGGAGGQQAGASGGQQSCGSTGQQNGGDGGQRNGDTAGQQSADLACAARTKESKACNYCSLRYYNAKAH